MDADDMRNPCKDFWDDRKEFGNAVELFNDKIIEVLTSEKSYITLKNTSESIDRLSESIRYNYLYSPLDGGWIGFDLTFYHDLCIEILGLTENEEIEKNIEISYHDPKRFDPIFVAMLMIGETK